MTLRQTIQAAPAKATELITKLSATSNQALKTRENLFAQLGDELTRYVEIEERHFLPLLRKHPETKGLAVDAFKGNKELRASLEKLSAMPKDDDEFLAELDVLNKSVQRHVRNERKELLPAVLKALSDEEAGALATDIEDAVAQAEEAKRDEKREAAAQAKRQAEEAAQAKRRSEEAEQAKRQVEQAKRKVEEAKQAERQAEEVAQAKREAEEAAQAKREAEEAAHAKRQAEEAEQAKLQAEAAEHAAAERAAAGAQQAAEHAAREATEQVVDTMARGTASVQDGVRQVTARIQERTRRVASDTQEAMNEYGHASRKILDDLKAVKASSSLSAGAVSEIYSAWFEWFGDAARANAEASQQLMQCRTVQQVAELQREFVTGSLRSWMERNAKVLEITQRTSKQALGPLDGRLSEAA